jgi:phosphoesterase RecJ-like protein
MLKALVNENPEMKEMLPYQLISGDDLELLKSILSSPKNIVITTHHKPDADALGSSLGLAGYLKKIGHQVQVITPSDYPGFLNWMPGQHQVMAYEKGKPFEHLKNRFLEADIIFCLDFNSLSRIFDLGEWVNESKATKVMIDHHLQPDSFARFQIWDTRAAATAELIFDFITLMGHHELIDIEIGECLYAGLLTDTGSFKHPSTNRTVHLIVADLLRIGVNPSKVFKLVYDNNNLNRLRFLGFVLKDKLEVYPDWHTAIISISKEELAEYNVDTGDTEGIVNYGLSLKGIVLGIVIIDRKELVKLSFRSVGDFDVNAFARRYFEGGGHKNASGGKSEKNLNQALEDVKAAVEENKELLASAYQQYFENTLAL